MTTSTQTLDSTPPLSPRGIRRTPAGWLGRGIGAVLVKISPRTLRRRVREGESIRAV